MDTTTQNAAAQASADTQSAPADSAATAVTVDVETPAGANPADPAASDAAFDPTTLTRDVIGRNPRFKKPALAILKLVRSHGDAGRAEVERLAADSWPASFPESPSVVVDMLVRNKALVDRVTVDGEPYRGTLEDVQLDESVSEDADVAETLALTQDGARLLQDYAPQTTIAKLFESHPHYADVYRAALWACDGEQGCTRSDLEEQIKAMPQLQPDPETGQTRVYPQYFIDALETAGGIEWDGAWRTTPAGREAMEA